MNQWMYDEEAEDSIISCLLGFPDMLPSAFEVIRDSDFYFQRNSILFGAMQELFMGNIGINIITLGAKLSESGKLESVGGKSKIAELACNFIGKNALKDLLDLVKEKSKLRSFLEINKAIQNGIESRKSSAEILESVGGLISGIINMNASQDWKPAAALVRDGLEEIDLLYKQEIIGIPIGLIDIDKQMGGLHKKHLTIIAARPSMGKTSLATLLAMEACRAGFHVGFVTLEVTANEIYRKFLTAVDIGLGMKDLNYGQLTKDDWTSITNTSGVIADFPLHVWEAGSVTIEDLRVKSMNLKMKGKLDLLIIDYLQLMVSGTNSANREQVISNISRGLKLLAKDLDVSVVCLSQLNRECERRENKRPHMSDLRESGAIEQDADGIIMLYRDEFYNPDTEDKGIAEILLRKNRMGPTGEIQVAWIEKAATFRNLESQREEKAYAKQDTRQYKEW